MEEATGQEVLGSIMLETFKVGRADTTPQPTDSPSHVGVRQDMA